MMLGHWKNFDELEEALTFEELIVLLESYREQKHQDRQFAASLKGIKMEPFGGNAQERFNKVKERATARLSGKTEDEVSLSNIGIGFTDE